MFLFQAVIVGQIKTLNRNRKRVNDLASLRANHILVLNLAVADMLMGIYLLSVGINYERLKGSYCKEELLWRGSSVCTWMGITALISCEASLLMLVLLTSVRLYTIIRVSDELWSNLLKIYPVKQEFLNMMTFDCQNAR